jgi:protein-S-isoprenylcysteine O-methyltransferase Ste14
MIFKDIVDKSIRQKFVFCVCVLASTLISLWEMIDDISVFTFDTLIFGDNLRQGMIIVCILIYLIRLMITTWVFQKRKWTWQEAIIISIVMSLVMHVYISAGGSNLKAVGSVEIIGVVLYLGGSYLNTQSEYSRHLWKHYPGNKGKLYTKGLFSCAMHINYLGDVVLFAGLALVTHFRLLVIPGFMILNFVFNIIPSLDRYLEKKYNDHFITYAGETSKLIPWIY